MKTRLTNDAGARVRTWTKQQTRRSRKKPWWKRFGCFRNLKESSSVIIRRRKVLRHTKKPYGECHIKNVESQVTVNLSQQRMLLVKSWNTEYLSIVILSEENMFFLWKREVEDSQWCAKFWNLSSRGFYLRIAEMMRNLRCVKKKQRNDFGTCRRTT